LVSETKEQSMRFTRSRGARLSVLAAGAVIAGAVAPPVLAGPQRKADSSATVKITCRGTVRVCKAVVSIAGGASNRRVVIELPGTSWKPPKITVVPRSSRGAYLISNRRFALGGSEYRFTLNAVRANPRGAHLTLTFRQSQ
jgi:hypothetical protein